MWQISTHTFTACRIEGDQTPNSTKNQVPQAHCILKGGRLNARLPLLFPGTRIFGNSKSVGWSAHGISQAQTPLPLILHSTVRPVSAIATGITESDSTRGPDFGKKVVGHGIHDLTRDVCCCCRPVRWLCLAALLTAKMVRFKRYVIFIRNVG